MPRMTTKSETVSREILAERLREWLADAGRGSRKALAEKIGVHPTQISQYVAGTENIGLNTLDILADALGCEPFELLQPREEL